MSHWQQHTTNLGLGTLRQGHSHSPLSPHWESGHLKFLLGLDCRIWSQGGRGAQTHCKVCMSSWNAWPHLYQEILASSSVCWQRLGIFLVRLAPLWRFVSIISVPSARELLQMPLVSLGRIMVQFWVVIVCYISVLSFRICVIHMILYTAAASALVAPFCPRHFLWSMNNINQCTWAPGPEPTELSICMRNACVMLFRRIKTAGYLYGSHQSPEGFCM